MSAVPGVFENRGFSARHYIDFIGGYFNAGSFSASETTYYKISHLQIDDSYIGPPAGFIGSTSNPAPTPAPTPSPTPSKDNGLPWASSFETGDSSEWNGWNGGTVAVSNESSSYGSYASRISLVAGTLNDNYEEQLFGDYQTIGLDKVEEVYVQFDSKFESGYTWPVMQGHKLAILNLTDANGQRRYQVFINVDANGRYVIDHSYIDSWSFFGLTQNIGGPVSVRFDQWDKLKMHVKLNTPGSSDGIVRLWVNNELMIDRNNLNLRENSTLGLNKLILSSYTTNQSGSNGVQWSDNWSLSTTVPSGQLPSSPTILRIEIVD